MNCEYLAGCLFYQEKMPMDKGLGSVYRKNYCETDHSKCARYLVVQAIGREHVPTDLYPNMYQRAEQIIAKKV